MSWQDLVLSITSIAFLVSLLPQVYGGFKDKTGPIKAKTSVPTFLGGFINALVFASLGLSFSATLSVLVGTMWLILFIQRLLYNKH